MMSQLVKKVNAIQTVDISNLVKKTSYNIKVSDIEKKITVHDYSNKYITAQKFNR